MRVYQIMYNYSKKCIIIQTVHNEEKKMKAEKIFLSIPMTAAMMLMLLTIVAMIAGTGFLITRILYWSLGW